MAETNANGNRLEEAIALLMQNQATLMQTQAQFIQSQALLAQAHREYERDLAALRRETRDQFAQLIEIVNDHTAILKEHGAILAGLPAATAARMGFKPPADK